MKSFPKIGRKAAESVDSTSLRAFVPSCLREENARAAFTFVEILAALIFLAILLPAVFEGITLANRASVLAERQAVAVELTQNKLAELTLDDTWTSADPRGDFGPDWPGYRWESTQTAWDMDTMTVLTVQTFFPVQGREQSLSLSTLVSSTASTLTTTASSSTSGTSGKTSK